MVTVLILVLICGAVTAMGNDGTLVNMTDDDWVASDEVSGSLLHTGDSTIHYVATGSPSPAWPYTSWATAAHVIQDAVDAANTNDTVLVTNGVYAVGGAMTPRYSLSNRVCITRPMTLRSVSGPEHTLIVGSADPVATDGNGPAAVRCAYIVAYVTIEGFTLTNGHTHASGNYGYDRSGGGAVLDFGGVFTDCMFLGNSASFEGGVVCRVGGTLNNCTISHNSASYGGGVECFHGGTLNKCTISLNSATRDGGGASSRLGGMLNNCIISDNSAGSDGGGCNACWLRNCTVFGNSATNTGGGVNGGEADNCIIWSNRAGVAGNNWSSLLHDIDCCCTFPYPRGTGHITNDPQFVNAAAGDFHLRATSPCINAGTNAHAVGDTDFDGNPRIHGGTVDMGAYEYVDTAPMITMQPTNVTVQAPDSAMFAVSVRGAAPLIYEWRRGSIAIADATNAAYSTGPTSASDSGATFDVIVSNTHGAVTSDVATLIVAVANGRYVDVGNHTGIEDGTPSHAYTNIQAAVDAAADGDTILVAQGTYCETVSIASKTLHLLGGYEGTGWTRDIAGNETIIDGQYEGTVVFLQDCDTVVDGFVIQRGEAGSHSGGGVRMDWRGNAVVSNCVVRWNRIAATAELYGSGAAAYVNLNGGGTGTIARCTIHGNQSAKDGAGAIRAGFAEAVVHDTLIVSNSGSVFFFNDSSFDIANCTVANNGGGVFVCDPNNAAVRNCIFWGNQQLGSDPGTIDYSLVQGGYAGTGNLATDPLFVDTGALDYSLQRVSPCVNAGSNGGVLSGLDLVGNDRVVGGAVDMGCYEQLAGTGVTWHVAMWNETGTITGSEDHPFTNIMDAVDSCLAGDVVLVHDGTYTESVDIVTSDVTVRSENGYLSTTVVTPDPYDADGDVFSVATDNVTVQGFTVYGDETGLWLEQCHGCNVISNRFGYDDAHGSSDAGLSGHRAIGCTIAGNVFTGNEMGMWVEEAEQCLLANNMFTSNAVVGFELAGGDGNAVVGNTISHHSRFGMVLGEETHCIVTRNEFSHNGEHGIKLSKSTSCQLWLNDIVSNGVSNVATASSSNRWYSRVPVSYEYGNAPRNGYLGNFYDDRTGDDVDGDGIGSVAYGTDGGNDLYPLWQSHRAYPLEAWWLGADDMLYLDDVTDPRGETSLPAETSAVWLEPNAFPSPIHFTVSDSWTAQFTAHPAPGNGQTFLFEVGYSSDGTGFVAAGPSGTITAAGGTPFLRCTNAVGPFIAPAGSRLAVRITNNNGSEHSIAAGGPWSFVSTPKPHDDDIDRDSISDTWELMWATDLSVLRAAADYDRDGLLDREEQTAGTCPTDRSSVFAVTEADMLGSGAFVFYWDSVTGRLYRIYETPSLMSTWSNSGYEVQGDGTQKSYTNDSNSRERFFRIGVEENQ